MRLRRFLHSVYVNYGIPAEPQFAYGDELISLTLCGFYKRGQVFLNLKSVVVAEDYAAVVELWQNRVQYGLGTALLLPVDGVDARLIDFMAHILYDCDNGIILAVELDKGRGERMLTWYRCAFTMELR